MPSQDEIPQPSQNKEWVRQVNQAARVNRIAGEMGKAICNLANIAEDFNGLAVEENERGPDNNAIGVIVFDDGSGVIVEYHPGMDLENGGFSFLNGWMQILHEFSTPEDAENWFSENASERTE